MKKLETIHTECQKLKVTSATFLLVWFFNSKKETTCETGKKIISLQKLFSFLRKFRILDIQIS